MSEGLLREVSVGAPAGASPIASSVLSHSYSVCVADFARDGFLSIPALTAAADTERIRALLDPLFARFNTLGDRAVDLAGPREAGKPLRSPATEKHTDLCSMSASSANAAGSSGWLSI